MSCRFRLPLAIALAVTAALPAQAQAFRRYDNARYGTMVDVPAEFRMQPAPENNDGRTFVSPDGRGQIVVFGSHGPEVATGTFEEYRGWMAGNEEGRITYRAGGPGWFVLSGTSGSDIFYLKVVAGCRDRSIGHHIRIMYPAAQKAQYDAIVRRVAGSLTFRDSDECGGADAAPGSAPAAPE